MATGSIAGPEAARRTALGRVVRVGIAVAYGVLVVLALAEAGLGMGSDGAPAKEWLLVAVGLLGVAVLVLMDDRHITLTVVLAVGCLLGLAAGVYGTHALTMLSDAPCLTASLNTSWPVGPCSVFEESRTVARYLVAIGAVSSVTLSVMFGTSRVRKGGSRRD